MTSRYKPRSRAEHADWIAGRADRIAARAIRFMLGAMACAALALAAPFAWRTLTQQTGAQAEAGALDEAHRALLSGDFHAAEAAAARAVQAEPRLASARLEHASYALRIGAWKLAQAELDVAGLLGLQPEQLRAVRAQAWLVRGDPRAALAELAGGTVAPADRRLALRVEAMALSALGDPAAEARFATLIREASGDPDAWIALARHRETAGNRAGAIAAVDRAIRVAPTHVDAVTLRGVLIRDQYGLTAAMPWLNRAIALDPRHAEARIEHAMILADLGQSAPAWEALAAARTLRPNHPRLHLLEAALHAREGDFVAARLAYFRVDPAMRVRPNGLLLGGAIAVNQGQPAEAARLLTLLLERQPLNLTARTLLARAWLEAGNGAMALQAIRPITERADADPYALVLAARALEAMGDNRAATAYLDRAAPLRHARSVPFKLAADVASSRAARSPVAALRGFMAAGKMEDARRAAESLAVANPGTPAPHLALGDVLLARGQAGPAAAAYQRAANLAFTEGTMLRLADAWLQAGNAAQASTVLGLYLEQQPASVTANALAGAAYLRAQDWAAAIRTLEAARSAGAGSDARVLADLAYAYLGAGQGELALPHARRAYALMPMNERTSHVYGLALLATGIRDEGPVALLGKSVAMAPDEPRYRLDLGVAYAAAGRHAEARELLAPLAASADKALAQSARQELARF